MNNIFDLPEPLTTPKFSVKKVITKLKRAEPIEEQACNNDS